MRNPLHAAYQTVTTAGSRLVAGGEHGLIVFSDDNGVTWKQAQVPVSAGILAIRFATPQIGWAIGSFGVVLHTTNGGENWALQLNGIQAAKIMVETAKANPVPAAPVPASTPGAPPAPAPDNQASASGAAPAPAVPARLRRALTFVTDGPDKPFLVLQVIDAEHVRVIGAYNMAFETSDGGKSWTEWDQRIDDSGDLHAYGLAGSGAATILVGEQGMILRGDPAVRMTAIQSPYEGSFFGALDGGKAGLFAFGLIGHLYQSRDGGASWTAITDPSKATLTAGLLLRDGTVVFGDMQGSVWRLSGEALERTAATQPWPITAIAEASDGALVFSGLGGLRRVERSAVDNKATVGG